MRRYLFFLFCLTFTANAEVVAQANASSILNPNISLIGDFSIHAGNDRGLKPRAFELREAELGLQSSVDPYGRADVFIAVNDEGKVELEEGYFTWLTMPAGFQSRLGKFRSRISKFNLIHPPETAFADRPLSTLAFLGEEGLSGVGASLSYLLPLPLYIALEAEVTNNFDETATFSGGNRNDLGYLGRLSTFLGLSESASLNFGGSAAFGTRDVEDPASKISVRRRPRLVGVDMTFRWKPVRRSIYRSITWQTEFLIHPDAKIDDLSKTTAGGFSFVDFQFARRWHIGGRYDYTQSPDSEAHTTGGLGFLTFAPSEFSLLSLQGKATRRPDGTTETAGFLKLTFNIGPHGAHSF